MKKKLWLTEKSLIETKTTEYDCPGELNAIGVIPWKQVEMSLYAHKDEVDTFREAWNIVAIYAAINSKDEMEKMCTVDDKIYTKDGKADKWTDQKRNNFYFENNNNDRNQKFQAVIEWL